jgi:hypothetical protein
MAKSKKAKSKLQPKELEMWNKWLVDNPIGSPNNLKGITEDEWLTKYAGGGNFGSKIGDAFKFAGDTLLSTVGASDVIGDSAYRNQGFADASRVGEQIGSTAGQLVGSAFGMGQAVKLGQQAIGGLDGEDKERARVEALRANPQAAGKYAQSIGQMNNVIQPLAGGIGAAGQIGAGAIQGNGIGNLFGNTAFMENKQIAAQGDKAFRPLGGPIGNVSMGEQVRAGSDRHKALQKHQADLDAYNTWATQMQPYTAGYGEPTAYNVKDYQSRFESQMGTGNPNAPDYSSIPEGQQVYEYSGNVDARPIYDNKRQELMDRATPFTNYTDASNHSSGNPQTTIGFIGPSNPGAIPDYDLIEEPDFNVIEAEQTQRQANVPLKGGAGTANVGTITGYDGEYGTLPSGLEVIPPTDNTGDIFTPKSFEGQIGILPKDLRQYKNQIREMNRSQQIDQFPMGGPINQAQGDGKFIEYQGPTHAGGGIDVNANGMPTNGNAVAEVEGGETMHDNGIESYIFSDRLITNPGDKKKLTFADASKKINNKYKNSENDKIAEDTRKMELEALKGEQETLKATMGANDVGQGVAAYGGNLPEYNNGGGLDPIRPRYEEDFTLGNTPFAPINTNEGLTGLGIVDDFNAMNPINKATGPVTESGIFPTLPDGVSLNIPEKRILKTEEGEELKKGTELPQDKINPAGYLASNIGNLNDLIEAGQATDANDFGRMNPNLVDYSAQRKELEKQAGVSRAISRENARNAGGAGAAMTNQVIANALIGSNLGSGLSESYMTEANTNAQIKNQAEQVNHQTRIQEKLADQQDLAKRKSTISQAMHSIGMNTQGYMRDLESARVGNINNKMWFDAIKDGKYLDLQYDEETGSTIIVTKDGDVWGRDAQGNITEAKKNK